MLIYLVYLLLTVWSVKSEQPSRDGRTLMKYKEGVTFLDNDTVPIQAHNFMDLMKQCKVFIDHSLFIGAIMKAGYALITVPSGWGKSMNLDMLRLFLEIPLDSEGNKITPLEQTPVYKMFTSGEIYKDNGTEEQLIVQLFTNFKIHLVRDHLGKECVILLNMSDTTAPDYHTVIHNIGLAVHREFKRHQYMIKVLEKKIKKPKDPANKLLQQFNQYLHVNESNAINETTIIEAFKFLCQLMHDHYKKRVFILIDDYDKPIHGFFQYDTFDGQQADKILEFMRKFVYETIETKAYRERDIVTGTFHLAVDKWTYMWYPVAEQRVRIHGYFGFDTENSRAFMFKFNIPQELWPKAEKWYGGYKTTFLKYCAYHPTSLIKYITAKEFQCFRKNQSNSQFVQKVIRKTPYWRDNVLRLISKQSIYSRKRALYKRRLENLTQVWRSDDTLSVYGEQITYLYLLAEAYVIELPDSSPEPKRATNYVKIPNLENAYAMADWMISYYKTAYRIDEKYLENAAVALYDFAAPENNETDVLQQSLNALYKHSTFLSEQPKDGPNSDSAHAIFYCLGLQMQCLKKFEHEVYYNRTKKGDMVIIDEPNIYGVVIELRYNDSSAAKALEAAETHQNDVFKAFGLTKKLRLVGIHIAHDKTVNVVSKFVPRPTL